MLCDSPPGHLVNSVTVAWKHQHASFHCAPLSVQACQDYRHLSSTSTPQVGLLQMPLEVLLQHFTIRMWICFAQSWKNSGMVDKLINCQRLLLLLKTVNSFYNSINSTLVVQWVNSLPSTNCVRAAVAPDHLVMLHKDRTNNMTSIPCHVMLCTNKTKMTVLGWPKTTPLAQFHQVCSFAGSFPSLSLGSSGLLVLAAIQYFGRYWQTCSPVTKPQRPTPSFWVS